MAEQEVIKHTKEIVKITKQHGNSWWHKIKELLVEIFIIVFAVTISIWFHNWSDYRSEQNKVKIFLTGLKKDIKADISETKDILATYKYYDTAYTFLAGLNTTHVPNHDSLRRFVGAISNNIWLDPHQSRFDGFKSSGKMLDIESDSLATQILFYYEEAIPQVKASEGGWLKNHELLQQYIYDSLQNGENDATYWKLLSTPKAKFLCTRLIPWHQLRERHEKFITLGQAIIKQIDAEYPEN